jgi:hypothetical protein
MSNKEFLRLDKETGNEHFTSSLTTLPLKIEVFPTVTVTTPESGTSCLCLPLSFNRNDQSHHRSSIYVRPSVCDTTRRLEVPRAGSAWHSDCEGDVDEVIAMLISNLPRDCSPAIESTAEDLHPES